MKTLRVLVVDDEPDLLELVSEILKISGHTPLTAISGEEAVQVLEKEKIDVVISDLRMPNGDGIFVLNYVNSMQPKPKFILVSGHADFTPNEAAAAGATKFYAKPYDIEKLLEEIQTGA